MRDLPLSARHLRDTGAQPFCLSLSATEMLEGSVSTGGLDILINRDYGIAGYTQYHDEAQCTTCVVNLGLWYDSDHADNHIDTSNSPASLSARTLLFRLEKIDNYRTVCLTILTVITTHFRYSQRTIVMSATFPFMPSKQQTVLLSIMALPLSIAFRPASRSIMVAWAASPSLLHRVKHSAHGPWASLVLCEPCSHS